MFNPLQSVTLMKCQCFCYLTQTVFQQIYSASWLHFYTMGKDPVYRNSIADSPDSTPGALRLLWHKACAAEARGTAGSGNGGHITDITIWWFGRDVLTASVLIFMYAILKIKNKKAWAPSSDRGNRHIQARIMTL